MSMLNPGIPSPTYAVSCDNTLRTVTSTNTADNGIMGWIADDVAAWNTLRSHLVSGVVTSVVLKTNGSLLVTVGGVTKEF